MASNLQMFYTFTIHFKHMIMKERLLKLSVVSLYLTFIPMNSMAKQWSLKDCITYALQNNISIQQTRLQKQSAIEDIKQAQAQLLPSLSLGTSQNVSYNPWPEKGSYMVAGSKVQTSVDKVYYNGSYSLSSNWTVWNGNQNRNQVKLNKLTARQAALDSAQTANNILEQIAQYYVQILYSQEAVKVARQTFETSKKNEERGQEFLQQKLMSKADVAQLTAQRAQDEYSIVQAESNLRNYKRQLKQLLQITNEEVFDIVVPMTTDEMALEAIPSMPTVYEAALGGRPEIANAALGIESSDLSIKMAKALKLPTVSLNAGLSTNTTSMNDNGWSTQLKNNFNVGAGVSVSIPLFDQRLAKTNINKAIIQKERYQLDLKDKQTALYSTIENYWLQAVNNQNMFKSAKISTESAQSSYELLSEQFRLGLKNIVELMTGKDNLLRAQQNELQAKYLAILNIDMLKFYQYGSSALK